MFFPNYTGHIYGSLSYMDITWSLAVEEFFYITFPVLIFLIPAKKIKTAFFFLLWTLIILSLVPFFSNSLKFSNTTFTSLVNMYILKYRLYAFIAGALSSYIYFYSDSLPSHFNFLKNSTFSLSLLGLFFILIFSGTTFSFINHQAYSIFFAVLLFSITSSGIRPFIINNRLINYFGKISYGIYMLHPIAVVVTLRLFSHTAYFTNNLFGMILVDVAAVLTTISISAFSYEFFEKHFLKKRKRGITQDIEGT